MHCAMVVLSREQNMANIYFYHTRNSPSICFPLAIYQRNAYGGMKYKSPAMKLSNLNNSIFSISQYILKFFMWSSQYLTNHLTNLNDFFVRYFNGFFRSFHVSVIINAKYRCLLIGLMDDCKKCLFPTTNERTVKRL